MFDTKLANSIQQDYRQAADNHRLIGTKHSKINRVKQVQTVAILGGIFTTLLLVF